jgi:hypothetical protein
MWGGQNTLLLTYQIKINPRQQRAYYHLQVKISCAKRLRETYELSIEKLNQFINLANVIMFLTEITIKVRIFC